MTNPIPSHLILGKITIGTSHHLGGADMSGSFPIYHLPPHASTCVRRGVGKFMSLGTKNKVCNLLKPHPYICASYFGGHVLLFGSPNQSSTPPLLETHKP